MRPAGLDVARQAKADRRDGRFEPIPGDDEFIPLPDQTRFGVIVSELAALLQDVDAEHAHVHAVKHGKALALEDGFIPLVRHAGVDDDADQAPARLRK